MFERVVSGGTVNPDYIRIALQSGVDTAIIVTSTHDDNDVGMLMDFTGTANYTGLEFAGSGFNKRGESRGGCDRRRQTPFRCERACQQADMGSCP